MEVLVLPFFFFFLTLLTVRDAPTRKILFRLASLVESQKRHFFSAVPSLRSSMLTNGFPFPTPYLLRDFQEKSLEVKSCCTSLNAEPKPRTSLPLEKKSHQEDL